MSGDIIGLIPFIQEQPADFQAKTEDVVRFAYVSKEDFMQTVNRHPKDFQIYSEIRDKLRLNPYYRGIH